MNIRRLEEKDCKAVAVLHNLYIPQGTLNLLGNYFTELIYRTIVDSKNAFSSVAEEKGEIVGFFAGTVNIKELFREFSWKYPFRVPFLVLIKMFKPDVLKKIFLIRHSKQFIDLPEAEFLSLVVTPEYRKQGLMFSFLNRIIAGFKERGVRGIRLSMHSSLLDNQRFYERFGAKFINEIKFSDNDRLLLYAWDISQFELSFDPFGV